MPLDLWSSLISNVTALAECLALPYKDDLGAWLQTQNNEKRLLNLGHNIYFPIDLVS